MEGEMILNHILQGDTAQLENIQNYIAPLGKILDSNLVNCVGKKDEECEKIIRKYGMYCLKLLRYCIEALKPSDRQDSVVKEECFKCSELGADMLSKIVTSGISLPSNLSISAITKLLFHLIVNALKEERHSHLLHFTNCLINITRRALELGRDKESRDATSMCKQTSGHLWNAAIKLEQSNSMEKYKKAVMALSLRNNSLDLLTLAKSDFVLCIERGLTATRQFQSRVAGACENDDQFRTFLFALLGKVVVLLGTSNKETVKDGGYNLLEELCIDCCQAAVSTSHCCELLELLSLLIKDSSKNQGRFSITQILVRMLQCALYLRLKRSAKKLEKINDDMKWSALQRRLTNITESLKHLDINLYLESQIIQVVHYLRCSCSKLFNSEDASSKNCEKIPDEMLSSLLNIFLVCFNILGSILKSKKRISQLISDDNSWKSIVRPRLSVLYFISTMVLQRSNEGLSKALQNSRKVSTKFDYVSCIVEAKTMTENVVDVVPAAADHYRYIATDAFNVGLQFFTIKHFNDASCLARLSCDVANSWRSKCGGDDGIKEALLCKKNELLSECLEKQGQWKESLCAMAHCFQLYALTTEDFAATGPFDTKALGYVDKWTAIKHRALTQLGEGKDAHQIKKCSLCDGWEQLNGTGSNRNEICTFLEMELNSYRKFQGYCTNFQEITTIEKLVDFFTERGDHLNACAMKIEKVKVMFQMSEMNTRQCLSICEDIIANLTGQQRQDSIAAKDILASSYFWCFVLRYSLTVKGSTNKGFQEEADEEKPIEVELVFNKMNSLNWPPDFLLSLHTAVKIWTQMVDGMATSNGKLDVLPSSDLCWNLQIASSVYGFLKLPLIQIHTLSVLVAVARALGGDDNLQTMIVADSYAAQILCEEGNVHCAELLVKRCEEALAVLGKNCRPETSYVFRIAKSHVFLLKEMYDDGWRMLKAIIDDIDESKKPVFQLVLLKAKLLCSKYLSLPACTSNGGLEDDVTHMEVLLDSRKHAEALVDHFVNGDGCDGTKLAGTSTQREQRGILMSHWSLLNELSCCFLEIGKVYVLQGVINQGKQSLIHGRSIASKYSSPIRFSEFTLQYTELKFLTKDIKACESVLKEVLRVFKPDASLFETVDVAKSFEFPTEFANSPFKNYDEISIFRLYALFLVSYCQYLRLVRKPCDVKTVIASLHVIRQNSVDRYQPSLVSLEHALGVRCEEEPCNDAPLPSACKRKTKAKGRRGKSATKSNEKNNLPEVSSEKAQVVSVSIIESGLKLHAIASDLALSEGDYTTLLSSVKEGLELLEGAQKFIKNPFLLDHMSCSLLYFLRGVAHVLSSKCGYDSWRATGCPSFTNGHARNVEDVTEEMASLEISPTVEGHDVKGQKKNEDLCGGKSPSVEKMLREWHLEDFDNEKQATMDDETRKSERGKLVKFADAVSVKPIKRTTTRRRKKLSKMNEDAEELDDAVETAEVTYGKMPAKKDCKNLRKGSRSAKKDSVKDDDNVLTRSSVKTRRSVRNKNNSASLNVDAESETTQQSEIIVTTEYSPPKRSKASRKRDSKKTSSTLEEHSHQNETDVPPRHIQCQDEEILKALECFQLSLEYVHPYYNPVLLTRVCHALVLCHGLASPTKAAIYLNLPMAATLRHQAMYISNKKIRKLKGELTVEQMEVGNDLSKLVDSMTLDNSNNLIKFMQLKTMKNVIGLTASSDKMQESYDHFMDLLPKDMTVCTISMLPSEMENVKYLLISRLRKNKNPVVLKLTLPNEQDEQDEMEEEFQCGDSVVRNLSTIFRQSIFTDFHAVLQGSLQSMKIKERSEWWDTREEIDADLERLLLRLEDSWFGKWRGILNGCILEEKDVLQLKSDLAELQIKALETFGAPIENEQLFEVLIECYTDLDPSEVTCALADLTGRPCNSVQVTKFSKVMEKFFHANSRVMGTVSRGPLVLILDKTIQHLPFESMPILLGQEVLRMPSLDFIASHLSLQRLKASASINISITGVDARKTYYVLNPRDDLARSEKTFHDWFSSVQGWCGVVGRAPIADEFKEGLNNHDLFLYIGHGTGSQYLKGEEIQKLHCQAVALLMGCSSGKLFVQGNCDATGMPLNYLLSGSPAVVANLWDVTDVDIDRFSITVLKKWLDKNNNLSLSHFVNKFRSICKLKYLVGAAPVVYGMPVYTRTSKK